MVKFIGAVMIIIACAWAGFEASAKLKARETLLCDLGRAFLALKREITYNSALLSQALNTASVSAGSARELFLKASEELSLGKGFSAYHAWENALNDFADNSVLKKEDYDLLHSFGEGLGISDASEQANRIDIWLIRLTEAESAAAVEFSTMGKVWRNLGWSGGLILVLMFF